MYKKMEIEFAGRRLSLETGRLAKQSHGSVLAQYGDTMVLATVVSAYEPRPNVDFLPLTVDYARKRLSPPEKFPADFFKREGRPSEKEILTSRLIDRSMRPLFPKGYDCETQIIVTVLSADRDNDSDVLSIIAASTALELSDIPHAGPVAAVRMGRIDGKLVVNPLVRLTTKTATFRSLSPPSRIPSRCWKAARASSTKTPCSKRSTWRMTRWRRFLRCSRS